MDDFDSTKDSSHLTRRLSAASLARLILLMCVLACSTHLGLADEDKDDETLSEETLKALTEFTAKAAESRIKKVNKLIEKSATDLADELELDEEAEKKLAEQFPSIFEGTQKEWKKKFHKALKAMLVNYPDPLKTLKGWKPKSFASSDNYASVSPIQTDEWTAALKTTLSKEQFTAYKKAAEEKAEKLRVELEDYFIRCEEMVANRMRPLMDTETELLKQLIDLDEERSKALMKASKMAIEETIDTWIVEWRETVYGMSDTQRKQQTGPNRYPSIDLVEKQNPKKHKTWKAGLAEIFTEEELENAKTRRNTIRNARSEALAMVLIDELQSFIGFSIEQRKKLVKLCAKPLLKLPDHYFVQQDSNGYYSIDPSQMFTMVSEEAKKSILPLLDKGQAKRWNGITNETLTSNRYYSSGGSVEGLEVPPPNEIDEAEAQRLITAYMYLKAEKSLATQQLKMEAKVDAVVRVGNLDEKKAALLRTAGKGAAQALAQPAITNMEAAARRRFQNITPADLPARLTQNNSNHFYSNNNEQMAEPKIWTTTIDRLLSDEQEQAWKAESEAGMRWNQDTQQAILMTEIDKYVPLATEKRDALEKLVAKALDDYYPEINNMFSAQWHIQGYYGLVPLAALENKELGKVLNKQQIELLRSRDQGRGEGMIDQLKRSRKQRLKNEKSKK